MHRSNIVVFAAIVALAAACDDGNGGSSPVCEVECQEAYLDTYDSCSTEFRDCLLLCTGFTDNTCLQACLTDFRDVCAANGLDQLETCTGGCSCTSAYNSCVDGCAGDTACQDGCMTTYEGCTGYDIQASQTCVQACYDAVAPCANTCQTTFAPDDFAGYINCTYDCSTAASACHRTCF